MADKKEELQKAFDVIKEYKKNKRSENNFKSGLRNYKKENKQATPTQREGHQRPMNRPIGRDR